MASEAPTVPLEEGLSSDQMAPGSHEDIVTSQEDRRMPPATAFKHVTSSTQAPASMENRLRPAAGIFYKIVEKFSLTQMTQTSSIVSSGTPIMTARTTSSDMKIASKGAWRLGLALGRRNQRTRNSFPSIECFTSNASLMGKSCGIEGEGSTECSSVGIRHLTFWPF